MFSRSLKIDPWAFCLGTTIKVLGFRSFGNPFEHRGAGEGSRLHACLRSKQVQAGHKHYSTPQECSKLCTWNLSVHTSIREDQS